MILLDAILFSPATNLASLHYLGRVQTFIDLPFELAIKVWPSYKYKRFVISLSKD